MESKLNLVKILQKYPFGIKLYSIIHGDVYYNGIDQNDEYPIVISHKGDIVYFTKEGKFLENCGECTLFPSKENRDWDSFKKELELKNKIDIHNFKPFDKVLVRDESSKIWFAEFYSHLDITDKLPYNVIGGVNWKYCIPFEGNEHLLNTSDPYEE